ncbi:hypothetical protein SAMN05660649_02588 [Desulfotomaculum arcticum]|uniref:Heavy-metal-associated domain-containing protein n=1 Tax=Desulfotruncus arcticus DSM 17038 TaxID=1121424 RepID=A0A1I2UF37_9FIRM|nr:hypothetical protein [Desulfotruncus arcticus]SFG75794.1 hypothetical protein SAMN05660649_02588 [Desulfotomaculum arcticum] [Desulfotruncus arcticus DSM 17038]
MAIITLEIPRKKTGEEVVKKLLSKPGIEQVDIIGDKVKIRYDPFSILPFSIERWVRETKVFPFYFG